MSAEFVREPDKTQPDLAALYEKLLADKEQQIAYLRWQVAQARAEHHNFLRSLTPTFVVAGR